jgi:hypothetical protein
MTSRHALRKVSFYTSLFLAVAASSSFADPVPVVHTQGALHGFLVIRTEAGATLGYGEVSQFATGDKVTMHTIYHFRDGSVDEETATYAQKATFEFLSDHHVQKGPFFAKPSDIEVDANGQVTTRSADGKTETQHIDLPNDLCNGVISVLLENMKPDAGEKTFGYIAPVQGKGRLIKMDIESDSQGSFTMVGAPRKASIYRIKLVLGGLIGIVAPIVNKQPKDVFIWVLEGDVPVFVREVGQLSEGGPVVSIELAGASFTHTKITSSK